MTRLRQLPRLFLRGSLCNETMRDLSQAQQEEVRQVVNQVAQSDELIAHKVEFLNQLGYTIAGDYREDRGLREGSAAHQEFYIIIWKATVFLLYHRSYSYECLACGEKAYRNPRNRLVTFNRRYPVCPNCLHVKITDPGDTELTVGTTIAYEEYLLRKTKAEYQDLTPPRVASCIQTIHGTKKIDDPYKIINDPIQRKKYYGEHIWGYFRQVIKENEIRQHRSTEMVSLPADQLAVEEIIRLLDAYKVSRVYYQGPENGNYSILTNAMAAPLEFTVEYRKLTRKFEDIGLDISVEQRCINIREMPDAPMMQSCLKNSTPITMVASAPANDQKDATLDYVNILADSEFNPEEAYDSHDVLARIKYYLPNQTSRSFFEILTNTGDAWIQFSDKYGDKTPKFAHIAEFLSVSQKQIQQWRGQIKVLMVSFGLVRESKTKRSTAAR